MSTAKDKDAGDVSKAEAGNAEVQKLTDAETEKGYSGTVTDPTPNENYTVKGVTSGAPTPETDKDAAKKAADFQTELGEKNSGLAR